MKKKFEETEKMKEAEENFHTVIIDTYRKISEDGPVWNKQPMLEKNSENKSF